MKEAVKTLRPSVKSIHSRMHVFSLPAGQLANGTYSAKIMSVKMHPIHSRRRLTVRAINQSVFLTIQRMAAWSRRSVEIILFKNSAYKEFPLNANG